LFVYSPLMMEYSVQGKNIFGMGLYLKLSETRFDMGQTIHYIYKQTPCECLRELDKKCWLIGSFCYNSQCSKRYQPLCKKELRVCMKCHTSQYCSEACQKQDYESHKSICKIFETGEAYVNPSEITSFTVAKRGRITRMCSGYESFTPIDPRKINPQLVGSNIENKFAWPQYHRRPLLTDVVQIVLHYQS
jgi:hypothetical protein